MGKRKVSRRKFLMKSSSSIAAATLANGPFLAVLDAIASGAIRRVLAEEAGITPRKWLDLKCDGAPPRWVYDLFLKSSDADNSNFLAGGNLQLATRYVESGGVYTGTQFSVSVVNGMRVPYLWRFNIPAVGGGLRPMAELLNNLLHIRGIDASSPGHLGARTLHYSPLGASVSIPAVVADPSHSPISAINVGVAQYVFQSKAGKSNVGITGSNYISSLLAPFRPTYSVAVVQNREVLVQAYVDAARATLTNSAIARDPNAILARNAVQDARELMARSFGDLNAVWASLLAKYEDLIARAIRGTYVGINDLPIGTMGNRDATYRFHQVGGVDSILGGDLRAIIGVDTAIPSMARVFALAEFVLVNNLSDSITLGMRGFINLKNGTNNFNSAMDEHYVGTMPSLLINSLMAFAHASCLLELIDRLKAAGIWNETVINNSGEFNRTPRTNGTGSDHGYQGASVALYSGIIQGPIILGNLAQDGTPTNYKGTWGYGAPQTELGNTQIDRGNIGATYAALLRVPSPVTARTSLVTVDGNTVTPNIATGKIIV